MVMGWEWLEGDIDVPELTERESLRDVLLSTTALWTIEPHRLLPATSVGGFVAFLVVLTSLDQLSPRVPSSVPDLRRQRVRRLGDLLQRDPRVSPRSRCVCAARKYITIREHNQCRIRLL